MPDAICDQCETKRHCTAHGCIPKVGAPAAPGQCAGAEGQQVVQRLEALMRDLRDGREFAYSDLVQVRWGLR